ncbi:MAG: head GIN domain-containing protein [Bacteroidales bacterium]
MSMKIGIAITYILALLSLHSCGRIDNVDINPVGVKEIITKELPAFDKITTSGMLKLIIKTGDKYEAIIDADSAYVPYIITGVKNGELTICLKNKNLHLWTSGIKITIICPSIKEINSMGATDIKFEDIKTNILSIDLSGSSRVKGKLECNELNIDLSGSSVLTLSGKANKCNIDLSGGGYFDAKDFETMDLNFDGSGSSVIEGITVKNSINADLSGSSVLTYKGEPKSINSDLSVASRLRKFENKK